MGSPRYTGTDWRCDRCDALLNEQPRFTTRKGTWRCKKCGALNDVSEGNLRDLLEMAARGITEFIATPLQDPEDDDW